MGQRSNRHRSGVCERTLQLHLSRKGLAEKATAKTGIGKPDLPGLRAARGNVTWSFVTKCAHLGQFEGFILHAPDTHGEVSTQEWQGTFRAELNNGGYTDDDVADVFTQRITTPLHIYKSVFIPAGV